MLWAGAGPRPKSEKAVRLVVGLTLDGWSWELSLGLPPPVALPPKRFLLDGEVKEELLWVGDRPGRKPLVDRSAGAAFLVDTEGERSTFTGVMDKAESVLAQLGDPHRFPEAFAMRERARRFRCYHQLRTEADAPARQPRPGVRTAALAEDGSDLAAALATVEENGDHTVLHAAVHAAFPGCRLLIHAIDGRFSIGLERPGLARPLAANELSDGTLRYLCLLAILLSPRPPELLALNEPETSLHPELVDPLADLIRESSRFGQIWVTTHSERLAQRLGNHDRCRTHHLTMVNGATQLG